MLDWILFWKIKTNCLIHNCTIGPAEPGKRLFGLLKAKWLKQKNYLTLGKNLKN